MPINSREQLPTGAARFVGRVGALAVALGIGVAVASSPGIAFAAPSDAAGTSSDGHAKGETAAKGDGDKADADKPKKDKGVKRPGAVSMTASQRRRRMVVLNVEGAFGDNGGLIEALKALLKGGRHAVRLYSGTAGGGTSQCFAPGAMSASASLVAGSVRVLTTTTC